MKKDNSNRVFRGGSWSNDAPLARVAFRYRFIPSYRYDYLGFRLSRVVKPLELLAEVFDETR